MIVMKTLKGFNININKNMIGGINMDRDLTEMIDNNGKVDWKDKEDFLRLAQVINIASKLIKDEVLEKIAMFVNEEEIEELEMLLGEVQEDIIEISKCIEEQELEEELQNQ